MGGGQRDARRDRTAGRISGRHDLHQPPVHLLVKRVQTHLVGLTYVEIAGLFLGHGGFQPQPSAFIHGQQRFARRGQVAYVRELIDNDAVVGTANDGVPERDFGVMMGLFEAAYVGGRRLQAQRGLIELQI